MGKFCTSSCTRLGQLLLIIVDLKERADSIGDTYLCNVGNSSENRSMVTQIMAINIFESSEHLESSVDCLMPCPC